ncbi:cytosolic phospholipase A2 zeta isoform X1 [Sarcophilus harrisii]|uniref:Phospholipase A2 n=1 Tax=Sarcophilus harrisii TaxID=9305 RepID=G3VNT3_SARHA|nr:cytosolic phospholipase A2 zeta isoform X1 [Sarcophilus harrisii]XP_031808009.1 cytosolic phospholipase A2 zeta isoform X1 [Sarcophilus harrisii]
MLWTSLPRQLVGRVLPVLGALLFQKREKRGFQLRNLQHEIYPHYDLRVKVVRARIVRSTDLWSKADCFVEVRLPTSSPLVAKTKVIPNCCHPEWNETFHFQIHKAVKNILELTLYDEDVLQNDQLASVMFDLGGLEPGQSHSHTFLLNSKDREELQVEFFLEKRNVPASEVVTNGVLVAYPCLRIQGTIEEAAIAQWQEDGNRYLQVSLPGAYEKSQSFPKYLPQEEGSSNIFIFHMNPILQSGLNIALWQSSELESQTRKLDKEEIPISSLPLGQEVQHLVTVKEGPELTLNLKAEVSSRDLDVRLGFDLCKGEQMFLDKRKRIVSKALQKVLELDKAPQPDQVPVVAVLGTGGGTRAMTSLYGSLTGLQELGFLDTVTYLSGISGSTWCISTIYKDPAWSQTSLWDPVRQARRSVCSSKTRAFLSEQLRYYSHQLVAREKSGFRVSLIDLWGLLIEYFLYQEENPAKLSDQQAAVVEGQNPYPIYAGINVHRNVSSQDFSEWCEFTPYEVGFPKYGAFIPTELFGSEFFMGRLLRSRPEPRICYLQGLWGSAFAANLEDVFEATIGTKIRLPYSHNESIDVKDDCKTLQLLEPARLRTRLYIPQGMFSQTLMDIFTSRFTSGENFNFIQGLCLHEHYTEIKEFLAQKASHLDAFPNNLTPMKECLYLVDGGFAINSPFPLVLLPQRDVDVILSFDYSLDTPFAVLKLTEKYCQDRDIPFPRIELKHEDMLDPQECYVFDDVEDPRVPIVVHFPLVNRTFQKYQAPGVERETQKEKDFADFIIKDQEYIYGMMNFTYQPNEFDRLVELSRYNILNNAEAVRSALSRALQRRQAGR